MAETTMNIHVRVLVLYPPTGSNLPVPGVTVQCKDYGWLSDTDLSPVSVATDNTGHAQVTVTFDDAKENKLNPFFVITVPEDARAFPGFEPQERRLSLPAEWKTKHHEGHQLPKISTFVDANKPLEIFIGLGGRLRVSWSDFDAKGFLNPLALPAETTRMLLADYDEFLWIDALNPDDTLTGSTFNPKTDRIVPAGENDRYPYFDAWPTEPLAFLEPPGPPRACIDPPGTPVATLGGGSFQQAGPVAVDSYGFVFLIDGDVVRRFYPDGTLCETIPDPASGTTLSAPKGLAVDQYRYLYIADTLHNDIVVFAPRLEEGDQGRYVKVVSPLSTPQTFVRPEGLAIVPERGVDADEFLAVVDSGNQVVKVFNISYTGSGGSIPSPSLRAATSLSLSLTPLATLGAPGTGSGQFQDPAGVAADRSARLYVTDRGLHRVSVWGLDASGANYEHRADWEKAGGGSGAGNREFNIPVNIAVDLKNDYVYVQEDGNQRIQRINAETGNHLLTWQPTPPGTFTPRAIAIDPRSEIFVTDSVNQRVLRASTFAANGNSLADGDAPRIIGSTWTPSTDAAHMQSPGYVYFDDDGKLWVADTANNRVLVFERNASGQLVSASAPPATGLTKPVGIVRDDTNHVYVVDSGNNRIKHFDAALAAQPDIGGPGPGDGQFLNPRGIAFDKRPNALLYVADTDNNRVQVLQSNGTFVKSITTDGATPPLALKKPEDVAVDSDGNVFIADTGNKHVVKLNNTGVFSAKIVPSVSSLGFKEPCGVSIDEHGQLIVTDRGQHAVYQLAHDGKVLAYWDFENLLRKEVNPENVFDPELRRMIVLKEPARAVIDSRGLLAVADTGNHRVRLARVTTLVNVHLTELDEDLPDISFRAITEASWQDDLGLRVEAGGDDDHNFITEPEELFARAEYTRKQTLGMAKNTNGAINALRVARTANQWLARLTRTDEAEFRWVNPPQTDRKLFLNVNKEPGSFQHWDSDEIHVGSDTTGKGSDAWDDSVIVHEMTHWVTDKVYRPAVPFERLGGDHGRSELRPHSTAITEGFAEYTQAFWGTEYGQTSRARGFHMRGGSNLLEIQSITGAKPTFYLVGGSTSAPPAFNTPERGSEVEGYFANCCYQIHHALVNPAIQFADSSGYWYPFNAALTDEQSSRFVAVIWKALRLFPNDPSEQQFKEGSKQYLRQVLEQAYSINSQFGLVVQALLELNNQLMPQITLTEGTSTTTPGTAVGNEMNVALSGTRSFIARITGPTGRVLSGYTLNLAVSGAGGSVALTPLAPEPDSVAGFNQAGTNRASNTNGIVNFSYTAPASAGTDTLTITYQPNFDSDDAFDYPAKGDDLETTLRKLYLYELRAAVKIWAGTQNNRGAIVRRTLTINAG